MEVFEKSETVDPEVRAHVSSLVSAIGGNSTIDGGRYVLGDDALACLKDLRRWLKLFDTKLKRYDVKRCLAEANLVKGDLLEILGSWNELDDKNLLRQKISLGTLELLTELTWPLTLDPETSKVNHLRHLPVLQLAQMEYKRAILHHDSESILHKAIAVAIPSLAKPRRERTSRDEGIINLVLYLVRNVVMIKRPDFAPSDGDDDDISRSAVINALQSQDVLQLILTICSGLGDQFEDQDVVIMEIMYHLVKGVDPASLFKSDDQAKKAGTQDLKRLILKEKSMLASQARNAPSRHNRFGTMIWVKQSDQKVSTMTGQDTIGMGEKTFEKMDSTKTWNKPKPRTKNKVAMGDNVDYLPVHLDSRARRQLQSFVSDFLDSSFNPLCSSLRKAMERAMPRVQDNDGYYRQFFYLISWFLQAHAARRQAENDPSTPQALAADANGDTPFAYIASVLNQETFVLLNRSTERFLEDKAFDNAHTCLLAFTQIMLTVWAMSESPSEDDQEIAENIQSRIFYEEQTHDRILRVLRGYQEGRQDFPYLDACTNMAHVFMRLLERYSKVNVDMYVKSKRRARKKAKEQVRGTATIEGLHDEQPQQDDDGAGDEVEAHREVQERKFDFARFSAKFVNEAPINTFLALLSKYKELNEEQLKRCHRFFYRVAFKVEQPILLYRVDILHLFHKLVQGPGGLDAVLDRKNAVYKEWSELVKQIFRRCIRKLQERPELAVEMLFTKIPNTLFYLEHGYEKEVVKSTPRAPAELEVKPGMDHIQQIGVAVGTLVDQGKLDVLMWVKTVISDAIGERRSWEDLNQAMTEKPAPTTETSLFGGAETSEAEKIAETTEQEPTVEEPKDDAPRAPSIFIKPDTDERKVSLFKDKFLRLLLKTLGFQRLGLPEDTEATWVVPSELSANQLEEDLDAIRKFEFDPPTYEDGRSAEFFTRSEAIAKRNAYEKEASDDDGDSDLDESLFVPGGPTRRPDDPRPDKPKKKRLLRKKGEITEEEREARAAAKRKKEKEKDAKVKSTLFVTESDDEDDEERDAEFFRMEALRRGNAAAAMKHVLMDGRTGHGEERASKRKSDAADKVSKKRKVNVDSEDDVASEDEMVVISSRESTPASESELESDEEDAMDGVERVSSLAEATPLSSQTGTVEEGRKEVVSDDEDGPVRSSHRPGRRLFVIDDDDDE